MKRNQLIHEPLGRSFDYESWVLSLKRGDGCFLQALVEGDGARKPWYWRFARVKILRRTDDDRECGKAFLIHVMGNQHIIPATGIYEPGFGIKRLVPIPSECEDIEHAVSLDGPIYEPRVDYRISGARAWLIPPREGNVARQSGAISLIESSNHSIVLSRDKPSPNAVLF
jgi:hypothetical protein